MSLITAWVAESGAGGWSEGASVAGVGSDGVGMTGGSGVTGASEGVGEGSTGSERGGEGGDGLMSFSVSKFMICYR